MGVIKNTARKSSTTGVTFSKRKAASSLANWGDKDSAYRPAVAVLLVGAPRRSSRARKAKAASAVWRQELYAQERAAEIAVTKRALARAVAVRQKLMAVEAARQQAAARVEVVRQKRQQAAAHLEVARQKRQQAAARVEVAAARVEVARAKRAALIEEMKTWDLRLPSVVVPLPTIYQRIVNVGARIRNYVVGQRL